MSDKKYVGTFQTEQEVMTKIEELKTQGFSEHDIYVITNDKDSLSMVHGRTDVELKSSEANWMDKFKAYMTGDEPVKAAFTNMNFTEEESTRYYNEVKNGGILLCVDNDYDHLSTQDDGMVNNENHLRSHDVGMENDHLTRGVDSNLTDKNTDRTPGFDNSMDTNSNVDVDQEERIRLHEEKLNIDKERVQTGEVNIGKHVEEDHQTVEVPVSREEVHVERRAVHDEEVAGEAFDDGDNIHIPIMEEEVEVTKRPVVKEEIVVSKEVVQDTETVSETVRHEEADIDRDDDAINELDKMDREEKNHLKENDMNNPNKPL